MNCCRLNMAVRATCIVMSWRFFPFSYASVLQTRPSFTFVRLYVYSVGTKRKYYAYLKYLILVLCVVEGPKHGFKPGFLIRCTNGDL